MASLENFFSEAPRGPQKSHFGHQKASASVLMLQLWIDGRFHGAFCRPPCTLSNQMFRGATASFRGSGPLGPHVIRPLPVLLRTAAIGNWNGLPA